MTVRQRIFAAIASGALTSHRGYGVAEVRAYLPGPAPSYSAVRFALIESWLDGLAVRYKPNRRDVAYCFKCPEECAGCAGFARKHPLP